MSEHDKERIEKEAETYADDTNIDGSDFWQDMYLGYIAGATAENERMAELLKQERDKAIDACVATLKRESELYNAKIIVNALYEVSLILEALKS